jgi:hypothetical protein
MCQSLKITRKTPAVIVRTENTRTCWSITVGTESTETAGLGIGIGIGILAEAAEASATERHDCTSLSVARR